MKATTKGQHSLIHIHGCLTEIESGITASRNECLIHIQSALSVYQNEGLTHIESAVVVY